MNDSEGKFNGLFTDQRERIDVVKVAHVEIFIDLCKIEYFSERWNQHTVYFFVHLGVCEG